MSEWKEYKLSGVATIQTGPFGSQLHQRDYVEKGTPIITVEHLGENRITYQNLPKVTDGDKERLKKYHLEDGDVVFSRVGSVDRRALVTEKEVGWLFSGRCLRVRADNKLANGAFLSYYFGQENFKEYIRRIAVGATMPSINTKILSEVSIKIPDLPTQTAIAEILSSLDDKIELNNKINQELENLAQTLFKQWFIDFEFPNENGEPYKSSGGELVESELGDIPKEWYVKRLSEIVKLTGGGTPKRSEDKYWNGDISWFSVQDVPSNSDVIVFETKEKITLQGLNNSSTKILPVGTTIITARGTVGKLAFVASPMAMNQSCYGVNGKDSIGSIFNYLNLFKSIDELKRNTHGAVFDTITTSTFETIKTLLPDSSTLNHFEMTLTPLFLIFEENVKENVELTTLRDTLLPKLISGELEVPSKKHSLITDSFKKVGIEL
jgi:type I restriction enzyme S subunit